MSLFLYVAPRQHVKKQAGRRTEPQDDCQLKKEISTILIFRNVENWSVIRLANLGGRKPKKTNVLKIVEDVRPKKRRTGGPGRDRARCVCVRREAPNVALSLCCCRATRYPHIPLR